PENETVIPMVLALEPQYRSIIGKFALLAAKSIKHRMTASALPKQIGDITLDLRGPVAMGGAAINATMNALPEQFADKMSIDAVLAAVHNVTPDAAADAVVASVLGSDFESFRTLFEESAQVQPGDISAVLSRAKQIGGSLYLMFSH